MSMTEELARLHELHRVGGLSDDEFARAKARLIDTPSPLLAGVVGVGTLRRSRQERWIAGVCGGLAQGTGTAPWVWRLLFALLLCWGGAGLVIYLLMWFFVPSD